MTIEVRRGDTVTLTFAALATEAGATLPSFATGDVVRFTIREDFASQGELVRKSSEDAGSITYNVGLTTGAVNIAADDWRRAPAHATEIRCVWDLELTRGTAVTTLATGSLLVQPDVTRPNDDDGRLRGIDGTW